MLFRIVPCAGIGLLLFAALACDTGLSGQRPADTDAVVQNNPLPGNPLQQPPAVPAPPAGAPAVPAVTTGRRADPVVLPGRVTLTQTQDVPSQRDGVLMRIHVKEGDLVVPGQLLAELDNRLAGADVEIKAAKIIASKEDLKATIKTRDEAEARAETAKKLFHSKSIAYEQMRMDILTHERYISEAVSKEQAVKLSELEHKQSKVVIDMHAIRATAGGEMKSVFKKPGEAVKAYEPVFQIHGRDTVRIEALMDVHHLHRVQRGATVYVEPTYQEGPVTTLIGHVLEVTSVAVSRDTKTPLVVSGSEDGTVRVWDILQRYERLVWDHKSPVRAVTCTGPAAAANLCLTGAADGKARLWDLNATSDKPLLELQGQHRGPVSAVAFSPDGKLCVTGGVDKEIQLWDVASGQLRYKFPTQHRGGITSLQFAQGNQVLSAASDNCLRLWQLGDQTAEPLGNLPARTGEVRMLGCTADGKRALFDQGKTLRVLSLPDGRTEAVLQNVTGATNFTTFALYSPDGRLIVTAGGAEGRTQLWRAADRNHRGYELRQFLSGDRSDPTCASFAPDGSFLVTGTKDRQVHVWSLERAHKEIDQRLTAKVVFVDWSVQSSARQARVWAELANPPERPLSPGTTAIMVIPDNR
ncbi:MAG: HlyD family efflux transporter periplasmic adaptor subunit [Planctomycetia bacterium]|nr:HlyD family efflux transporter periplasmic adaptor subunit [Planctomycetia bacterium]